MKIGFVLDDTLDSSDGVQQYVLTLGKWLSEQQHEVHYLVGETSRTDLNNVHSLAKNLKVKFNKNVLSIPLKSNTRYIKNLLADQNFDILHVQLPFSPLLAGKLIKYAPDHTKIVGTFHILPYSNLQFVGAKALSWMTGSMLKKFDKIVSVSPGAQQFARQAMGIKSDIIPNAVDLAAFNSGRAIRKDSETNDSLQQIVFLGRLVKRKGCMELLRAINLLVDSQSTKNIQLLIAGDGPDRRKLESYVAKHQLGGIVKFLGRISEAAKAELLGSADIVALPSISGESFGIVVVEAIASGAGVVVGGNNPGYSYVLSSTPDVLVDPTETKQFSAKLAEFINNPSAARRLGDIQRKSIANFDVSVVGKQVINMYKSVIAK